MADAPRWDTPADYARHRGVTRQAVHKAIAEGRIQLFRGRVDRALADREWDENTVPPPDAGGTANGDGSPGPSLARARAVREVIKAKREQLAYERESKQVEETIRLAGAEQARRTQEALLAVPARIAPLAAMKPRAEVERIVAAEIRAALAGLAGVPRAAAAPARKRRAG